MKIDRVAASAGLPPFDGSSVPASRKRFPDGAHFRLEIPSVEGPRVLEAVLTAAREHDVLINRVSQGSGAMLLKEVELRDMAALGAEACLFNGGGIRASRDYRERFTYGDLEAEVPFDNEMVIVRMPGRVVRAAVTASRALAPADPVAGRGQLDSRPGHRGLSR